MKSRETETFSRPDILGLTGTETSTETRKVSVPRVLAPRPPISSQDERVHPEVLGATDQGVVRPLPRHQQPPHRRLQLASHGASGLSESAIGRFTAVQHTSQTHSFSSNSLHVPRCPCPAAPPAWSWPRPPPPRCLPPPPSSPAPPTGRRPCSPAPWWRAAPG